MTETPLVLVVDDDEGFRASVSYLLGSVGIACKTFASAQEALESTAACSGTQPGCLLLDIRMPGISGLEFLQMLGQRDCPLPVLIITGHGDVPLAVAALKAGAEEFLEKPCRDQSLLDAIHAAIRKSRGALARSAERKAVRTRLALLSRREREVLDFVLDGRQNKEIAAALNLSIKTVEGHRQMVMEKMGTRSVVELTRMMIAAGEDRAAGDRPAAPHQG